MVKFAQSLPLIVMSAYGWCYGTSASLSQIVPDRTLGAENSTVTHNVSLPGKAADADYLQGGAVRGSNLFHSFSEFNIAADSGAYFASPSGIEHIFTRITGANPSQIEGILGVNGNANLFLLNPHGVIFGANSQLDLSGSLFVTTGDRYLFENDFSFSASNPELPPLLTVNFPIGVQFGAEPGAIVNRAGRIEREGQTEAETDLEIASLPEGLRIGSGQNLSFLGGEIAIEGGYLNTDGGTIELAAIEANNRVGIAPNGEHWQLDYSQVKNFADLKLEQHAGIDGGQTGTTQISLKGRNISLGYDIAELAEYSLSDFFSLEELPRLDELPGNRIIIAAQNLDAEIPSRIDVRATETFSIVDPGKTQQNLLVHTSGSGDAGEINISAKQIVLYGASLESWTLANASGDAGTISLVAEDMTIQHGGAGVNTDSQGDGGTIDLDIAKELKIQYGGFGAEVFNSGDGGEILIDSQNIEIQNAGIGADTRAAGNGGTIIIDAENLEIRSGGMGVSAFAAGDGGKIDLNIARNLKVVSGGFGADASSAGDGGSIEIEAQNIELIDAGMGANTRRGTAQGGNIELKADRILLKNGIIGAESGQDEFDERNIDERQEREDFIRDAGNGGNIFIQAAELTIDGGNITTSTFGRGNAGDIRLQVDSFKAIGTVDEELVSGINSSTDGDGRGGNISITGDRIKLVDGATIAANSTQDGQAGNIEIDLSEELWLKRHGTISVDGGVMGLPGEIIIQSRNLLLDSQGRISATTNLGTQGNIRLRGENLRLKNGAQIVTNAGKDATGGNIFIDLKQNILGLDNSKITASAEQGQGGNINIITRGIFLDSNSQINASSQFGIDGSIGVDSLDVDPHTDLIRLPSELIDPELYLSTGCSTNKDNQFSSVGKGGLPENPLNNLLQDGILADLEPLKPQSESDFKTIEPASSSAALPIEAAAWRVDRHGKIELVAIQPQTSELSHPHCLSSPKS